MHKKIGIIGADPDNGNRGVGALIYSVLYLIKRIEENKMPPSLYLLSPRKCFIRFINNFYYSILL